MATSLTSWRLSSKNLYLILSYTSLVSEVYAVAIKYLFIILYYYLVMSIPALRQPKLTKNENPIPTKIIADLKDYLIVTLKDGTKLVVSSDAYHGIVTAGGFYRCVFCETEMFLDILCKERHKTSQNHRKILENYPHLEEYKENLIRKITASTHYCTICNVIVLSHFLHKHIVSEVHTNELNKALTRADSYQARSNIPSDEEP